MCDLHQLRCQRCYLRAAALRESRENRDRLRNTSASLRHGRGVVGQHKLPSAASDCAAIGSQCEETMRAGRRASERPKPRGETGPASRDVLP